jgi:GTP1/Obg family GTP-binding protein
MMDSGLVQDLSRILLTLHEGKAHTNAIIKKTGIYKNNVYEATRFLVKARLATRFKIKNVHRQKMFTQLNEFGQQLADLVENAEKFEKSFSQLTNTIRRVYNLPEDAEKKVIRSLLLNRGLNHQEIDKYEEHVVYAEGFERDSMSILIDGMPCFYLNLARITMQKSF